MVEELAPPDAQPAQPAADPNAMMTFSDLEKVAAADMAQAGQGQQAQTVMDQQAAPVEPDKPADPFTEALMQKGFKTPEDLLKSYEEAHAKITKLAQERSKLAQDMDVLMQIQQQYVAPNAMGQPQQPADGQGDFNEELYKEISPKVKQEVLGTVQALLHEEKVKDKVAQIAQANPEEFKDLLPIMTNLAKQYPQVGALPNGVEMLYNKAKEIRTDRVGRLLKSAFGGDVDMDKLRSFLKASPDQQQPAGQAPVPEPAINQDVARAAYLPPTGSTSQQAQKPVDYSSQMQNLLQSGPQNKNFVDTVTDLWWQKNMNNPAVLTEAQLRNRR